MANPVCEVLLTDGVLQRPEHDCSGSGAVVDFWGVVRPMEHDRAISGIEYEAHRAMATHQMEQIAREAVTKFRLNSAVIHHRVGFVAAGEPSVFVRTTSRNRAESYAANEWMMEQLKKRVPIWKQPKFKSAPPARAAEAEPLSHQ